MCGSQRTAQLPPFSTGGKIVTIFLPTPQPSEEEEEEAPSGQTAAISIHPPSCSLSVGRNASVSRHDKPPIRQNIQYCTPRPYCLLQVVLVMNASDWIGRADPPWPHSLHHSTPPIFPPVISFYISSEAPWRASEAEVEGEAATVGGRSRRRNTGSEEGRSESDARLFEKEYGREHRVGTST